MKFLLSSIIGLLLISCMEGDIPAPLSVEEQHRCQDFCKDNGDTVRLLYSRVSFVTCECKKGSFMNYGRSNL